MVAIVAAIAVAVAAAVVAAVVAVAIVMAVTVDSNYRSWLHLASRWLQLCPAAFFSG